MSLELCPVSFADGCEFVRRFHRHHVPPVGHKFSIGVEADGVLVGVAVMDDNDATRLPYNGRVCDCPHGTGSQQCCIQQLGLQ